MTLLCLGLILRDGVALGRSPTPVELDGDSLGARGAPSVPQDEKREIGVARRVGPRACVGLLDRGRCQAHARATRRSGEVG